MGHHVVKVPGDPQPLGLHPRRGLGVDEVPQPVGPGPGGVADRDRQESECQLADQLL